MQVVQSTGAVLKPTTLGAFTIPPAGMDVNGTTYQVQVAARVGVDESDWSTARTIQCRVAPPAPDTVTVKAVGPEPRTAVPLTLRPVSVARVMVLPDLTVSTPSATTPSLLSLPVASA